MKILMLAEGDSANTKNWTDNLTKYGEATITLWSMPKGSGLRRLLYLPMAIFSVRKKIRNIKPDVVIGYRTTSYGFIGAMSGFRPLVLAAQGVSDVWPPGHWSNVISSMMARYAIKRADLIHAWGKNMVPSLYSLGAREDQIMIMPRGIDVDKFPFKLPFMNPQQLTLVVSRSLYPEYHHDLLLTAFAAVVKHFPEIQCRLIVAGHGPLLATLQEQCKTMGISDQVNFTGKVSAEVLSQYLQESDIYVSLPDTEGISSSLLEAMAAGCFPIVTDLPANRELMGDSNKNGILVSLNSAEVEKAILTIVEQQVDVRKIVTENRTQVDSNANARINSNKFVLRYLDLKRERKDLQTV